MKSYRTITDQKYIFNVQTSIPVFEIGQVKIYVTKSEEDGKYMVSVIDPTYYVNENSIEKYNNALNNKTEWFVDNEENALNIAMKLKMIFEYKESMNTLCSMIEEFENSIVHTVLENITKVEEE